jgi:hypothetical protein
MSYRNITYETQRKYQFIATDWGLIFGQRGEKGRKKKKKRAQANEGTEVKRLGILDR